MGPDKVVLAEWIKLSNLNKFENALSLLVDERVVKTPSDLYKLSLRHLLSFPQISYDESEENLEAVDKSRDMGLPRAILSLLPDISKDKVKRLLTYPKSFDELETACSESAFINDFKNEVEKLVQVGVKLDFRDDAVLDPPQTPFTNKIVVISGTLSAEYSIVKGAMESFGATVHEDISKVTDYLLAGEGSSDMVDRAIKNRVRVLTELDIEQMMGLN